MGGSDSITHIEDLEMLDKSTADIPTVEGRISVEKIVNHGSSSRTSLNNLSTSSSLHRHMANNNSLK